jgi:hypothetical protein
MARHEQLFSVAVMHEFYAGQPVPGLRYVPAAHTAELMRRERLLLRTTAAGMEVWRDRADDDAPAAPRMLLRFEVLSGDPLLRFYTAMPLAAPLRFTNRVAGADRSEPALRPVKWARRARRDGLVNQLQEPLFRVDIDFQPSPNAEPPGWRIALASRTLHWKYFFTGALAAKQLNIVDLDAADGAEGVGFVPAAPAVDGGSAYLSARALPIQKIPLQRLQLREVGAAGKVLIRRLPNASVENMGKDQGPNGQSMIVAEIYIHQ